MATARKHTAKNGEVSYYIRVYNGYDENGKQIEHRMTWKPDPSMSEKAVEKELERQKVLFEEKLKRNSLFDSNTTFKEYSEKWISNIRHDIAPKTYERYMSLLRNINMAIGHIRLIELQSQHLQSFYNNLREEGVNNRGNYAVAVSVENALEKAGRTKKYIADRAQLGINTVRKACRKGEHVSIETADAISRALNVSVQKIFIIHNGTECYSEKTILHYHRLIGTILRQATRDQLIPRNIATRDYMKAPRVPRKEAIYLDEKQTADVLRCLENEPIKWKTAVSLLIYTGMRRGELLGLEWKDIDFENNLIHIYRTSQFVANMGLITKDTKNISSERTIALPASAIRLLAEYREYCYDMREQIGDYWHSKIKVTYVDGKQETIDNDRIFTADNGLPMNPDSITGWIRKFIKRHNLPKFTPHSLRHTNASLLIANGVNISTVSKRLGHSNIATTTKIYSHALQSADEKASEILAEKLDPLYRK